MGGECCDVGELEGGEGGVEGVGVGRGEVVYYVAEAAGRGGAVNEVGEFFWYGKGELGGREWWRVRGMGVFTCRGCGGVGACYQDPGAGWDNELEVGDGGEALWVN